MFGTLAVLFRLVPKATGENNMKKSIRRYAGNWDKLWRTRAQFFRSCQCCVFSQRSYQNSQKLLNYSLRISAGRYGAPFVSKLFANVLFNVVVTYPIKCSCDSINQPLLFFTLISFYCRDATFPTLISFYCRDAIFSTLISFYCRDATFSTLISFYCRDATFSTLISFYCRDATFCTLIIIALLWCDIFYLDFILLPWCMRPFLPLGWVFLYRFYTTVIRTSLSLFSGGGYRLFSATLYFLFKDCPPRVLKCNYWP